MQNVYDLVDLADLNAVARALEFPDLVLGRWLPNVTVARSDFRYVTNDRTPQPAARYIAPDAEAPIGGRPGLSERRGALPPVKEKAPLTESDQYLVERIAEALGGDMAATIFADGALRTRAILQRVELAKGEALATGKVSINDQGLKLTVDFGVPAEHMDVAPTVLWSDRANSTPLSDATLWRDTYVANSGQQPGAIVVSQQVMSDLQSNAEIIGSVAGTASGRTRVTREDVAALFVSEGLPAPEVYDAQYRSPTGTMVRAIPADRFVFLPAGGAGFGQTQFGITREAVELARGSYLGGDGQPGVPGVAVTTMKTFDPVEIWVKAAAVALPVISSPELIFSAEVR